MSDVWIYNHTQDFFKKHGVAVMTIRELFDFIVDPTISDENVDSYLEEVMYDFLYGLSIESVGSFKLMNYVTMGRSNEKL